MCRIPARQPAPPAPPVAELAPLRRVLAAQDASAESSATQVCGPSVADAQIVVAVPGSFNPPHLAHLALLRAGIRAVGADGAVFVLSARTVDKEVVSGMLLEDRLWLLCGLMDDVARDDVGESAGVSLRVDVTGETHGRASGVSLGVVVTNRGLYVDQAAALHRLCPRARRVVFVIGFDKIVQILDGRYYEDREATLDRLFAQAGFLVAPRDDSSAADLAALLDRPENRRYAVGVQGLVLDEALASVSSTDARAAAAGGRTQVAALPERVARFLTATGCYSAPDGRGPYARRVSELAAIALG